MTDIQQPAQGQPEQATAQPQSSWYGSVPDEVGTYIQGKGWGAPADVVQSYQNLERLFTADKLGHTVAIPKEGDSEGWDKLYNRLGRPESADKYELPLPEGVPSDFADWAKERFHKLGLTGAQGKQLASEWNEYVMGESAKVEEQRAFESQEQQRALKNEWGAAYDHNLAAAKNAALALGVDADTIDKLESSLGYAGVMKFMQQVGSRMGEDKFVGSGDNSQMNQPMTPAQAQAELSKLGADPDFLKAWSDPAHPKHQDAKAKKSRLASWAYPS